jgi:hypothetical protein
MILSKIIIIGDEINKFGDFEILQLVKNNRFGDIPFNLAMKT